jgi:protein translocase SEC61 complex gamma subunit
MLKKMRNKLSPYKRVLYKATTPSFNEFKITALITLAGVCLVGIIGFAIYWLMIVVL